MPQAPGDADDTGGGWLLSRFAKTAMITFTFDDGYISTLEAAHPVLREFGMVATVGVICKELLWDRSPGFLGPAELRTLVDRGWEVASHSLFHRHLPLLPASYADETASWQYESAIRAFVTEYTSQEVATVICDGRFLPCRASIEDFQRATEGFLHAAESNRIYARVRTDGDAPPPLLIGSAEREIAQSRQMIERHGFPVESFIVPYSAWPPHLHQLGNHYYKNVAWVTNRLNIEPAGNLFRFSVTKDLSADDVIAQVKHQVECGSWCILCFHQIVREADWQFDWPLSAFQRLVQWVAACGIPVQTLAAGAELRRQAGRQQESIEAGTTVAAPGKIIKPIAAANEEVTIGAVADLEHRLRLQKEYSANLFAKFKAEEARRVDTAKRLHTNWTARKSLEARLANYGALLDLLAFARDCEASGETLRADAYIVHDMFPLSAGYALAKRWGGRLFCDVVDGALVVDRPWHGRWPQEMRMMFDAAGESWLARCDGLLTVSDTYAEALRGCGPPVHVIPLYRPAETVETSPRLRELCGVGADHRLLLTIGHIVAEFENVLHGLALIGPDFHLACLSRIVPDDYCNSILSLISELGIGERVHLLDSVPYDELARTASGADVGLIVLSPELISHWRTLPNRVFDFVAAGVPFCTPRLPEIVRMTEVYGVGTVVEELSPLGWATAIRDVLAHKEPMRRNCRIAASQLTWESCEERFCRLLPDVQRAAFLGVSNLTTDNRTRQMAMTLAQAGISVVVATRFQGDPPQWHDAIEFCRIDG
jgi:glycosyltransferase involved in cell wall biosynthesis